MTQDEWTIVAGLIDEWWPGKFDDAAASAWYIALADFDVTDVTDALKRRLARGERFRPSVAEIIGEIRSDPSQPTFDETLTLIRTALRAYNRPLRGNFSSEAEMTRAREQNVLDRAGEMHPLVGAFISRHGVGRLQDEVGELDGDYGAIRLNELEASWDRHVEAFDGRDVAALLAGRRGEGLVQLDPLSALGIKRPELTQGSEAA